MEKETEILGCTPREHMFVVHTRCGTPYTASGFKCMFHREIRRLGLDGLVFHGLRHTAGKKLAEAGCSDRKIMAILGHRTAEMVARYTRRAEQSRLAESAVAKLEARAKSV